MKFLFLTALMEAVAPACAGIHRCVDGETVTFSDRPCVPVFPVNPDIPTASPAVEPATGRVEPAGADTTAAGDRGRSELEASIGAASRRLELLHRAKHAAEDALSAENSAAEPVAHRGEPDGAVAVAAGDRKRPELEARIGAALRRLELLRREKDDVADALSAVDSPEARAMARYYSGIIRPLEEDLADMRARLNALPTL